MEDSAKRKERLQSMRMEASSASTERPSPSSSTANTPLSNPLINSSAPSQGSPLSPHRFDYYTDPVAAYSAEKRKTNDRGGEAGVGRNSCPSNLSSPIRSSSPLTYTAAQPIAGQQLEYQIPPAYTSHAHQVPSPNQYFYDTSFTRPQIYSLRSPVQYPSPASGYRGAFAHQVPSPNQSSYHTPFFRPQSSTLRSPVQYLSPASEGGGAYAHQITSPNQSSYQTPFPGPQSSTLRSPVQYLSPASGDRLSHHNLPRPWNMSGNSSEHSFTPSSSNGDGESRTNCSYSNWRGSPHSNSSGRGWQFRGRGRYHNQDYGLGRRRVDKFYVKSMLKDPWRKLKPVVGNILVPLKGPLPWLPKSIAPKKAKVGETSIDSKPKQNLAEFLASAFEDSINNEQEGEGSVLPKSDLNNED